MKVIDVLTKEKKEIDKSKLVYAEHKSNDYIISIPHSGRLIPVKYAKNLLIGNSMLIVTDLFTKEVYNTDKGIHIVSELNLFLVNMNRFREGKKDHSLSFRLQVDPLHETSQTEDDVLVKEFTLEERKNILKFYDQYHQQIKRAIQEMKSKFGFALIFDCHSTNSIGLKHMPDEGKERADFIIGTRNGASAHSKIISAFYDALQEDAEKNNFTIMKDYPFSGGFITREYGKPSKNVHAIQIEVKRALFYMKEITNKDSEDKFKLNPRGLKKVNKMISKAIKAATKEAQKIYSKKS